MVTRQNIYHLSDVDLAAFLDAVNALKADGTYDDFVRRHQEAITDPTVLPGEGPTLRNVAHRGPAFLPWHRYFIHEFELALQTKAPGLALPYWDWAADAALASPAHAPLWNTDAAAGRVYVGGDGEAADNVVRTGPFAGWTVIIQQGNDLVPRPGGILRLLGRDPQATGAPTLPTMAQVAGAVSEIQIYDSSPWNESQATQPSFRNRLEGWLRLAVDEIGSQLHNRVHLWVGGDMLPGTSPNDPVFFLHHCNVDRLWARWQHQWPSGGYVPTSGGPPGHNLNDVMRHLATPNATPARALDYRTNFHYSYDTDPL